MTTDEYKKCLDTMYGLRRFGIKLGLDVIQTILDGLGNPLTYKTIHIAGTNGKGSIASALSSVLHIAGYKTGLYTSPHLVKFNERICINNKPISDNEVVSLYKAVEKIPQKDREPTFFEFTTAMAFYAFARENVDWAIIETGMGGRLDATNIISPEISVISNISLEHQEYLGHTIGLIAAEKGGIIKPKTPVVTGVTQDEAISVIKGIARKNFSPLYLYGKDFSVEKNEDGRFVYHGMDCVWENMRTNLMGAHQTDNAALVLAACEVLRKNGAEISGKAIRKGISSNLWPGRLEIVSRNPLVILDGAHNLEAAKNLSGFLKKELKSGKLTMIIGILDDKPCEEILEFLIFPGSTAILTSPEIYRALPADRLCDIAKKFTDNAIKISRVKDAVEYALKNSSPDDAICIAGSLYVVGEAKEYFETRGIKSFVLSHG